MTVPALADIEAAGQRIAAQVHLTPTLPSRTIASRVGAASMHLKCESLQKTGSFKVRGALNAVGRLDQASRRRGVVTFSAGNHAQALAWASASLGVPCTVVMPAGASESKAAASTGYGATVILHGTPAEAFAKASALAEEHGYTFVHPFDQYDVMVGAATVGLEVLRQVPEVDILVVPIGGGGLLGGIAAAVSQLRPAVRLVGVEPDGAPSMRRSLDAGRPVRLDSVKTIADGLGAPFAGELTFPIIRDLVDDVVLVSDAEIADAMSTILSRMKLLAEGAGAAATAAVLAGRIPGLAGKHVVAILSGGNVDLDRLKVLI